MRHFLLKMHSSVVVRDRRMVDFERMVRWRGDTWRSVIFFLLLYLFLSVYVDVRLLHYVTGATVGVSGFPCTWSYLAETLSRPGGAVRYVSAFLSQWFMFRWIGPVVVVLPAWAIALCIDRILNRCHGDGLKWVRYVPAVVILFFYTGYAYHLEPTIALLVVLALFSLYLTVRRESRRASLAWFVALMVVAYYLAAAASLLFAVLCAIYELGVKRRTIAGVGCLLGGAVIPMLIGVYGFGVSRLDAYGEFMPWSWRITKYDLLNRMIPWLYVMLGCVPACLLLLGLWGLRRPETRRSRKKRKESRKKAARKARWAGLARSGAAKWVAYTAVLLGAASAGAYHFANDQRRTLYEIEYHRGRRHWEKVLALADRCPGQFLSIQARDQALYHLGRFADEMFDYQQHADALMLSHAAFAKSYWHKHDLYIDLGLIGQADEVLTESMVVFRDNPHILKKLALLNMISGKYQTARVYLGALRERLFFGRWAQEWLARLDRNPELQGCDEIQRFRALVPEEREMQLLPMTEMWLRAQVESGKPNRMAFEYLLALYMLRGEMWNVADLAGRMEAYDYEHVPRAFAEAVLLNNRFNEKKISLARLTIPSDTKQRFDEFMAVTLKHRTRKAAQPELARRFRNTYMYYYFYGLPR